MDKNALEQAVRAILQEGLEPHGVLARDLHTVILEESDRLDVGDPAQRAYTRDLFPLEQSPRLGAGLMELRGSDFPWELNYDEVDYVIDGHLTVADGDRRAEAGPGQVILIPKGSRIRFQADYARFLYVTYPADWQK